MSERNFKLLVPCGFPASYRIEGAVGAIPDVELIGLRERCRRSTLPPFLANLVFNFTGISRGGIDSLQNFFHLGDFFVVSDAIRKFLEKRSGCEFEVGRIQTKHGQAETTEPYWAMKVKTRIDCVEPDQSFSSKSSWSAEPAKPFSELIVDVKLADDVAPYFANKDSNSYHVYPSSGIERVSLKLSSVPSGVNLFEPMYWPHYLVVEESFAWELEKQCKGGELGYYFWTLGLNNVSSHFNQKMHDLR
jgi:hypothetical protein